MTIFLYPFLYNAYYLYAKILIYVSLCKYYYLSILFLMPRLPFWKEWEVLEPSNGQNFHIFNEMPTMCDSNKEGGSMEMWLRALALASECQRSDFSSSSY